MRYLWALLGLMCVALAMAGTILPLLPTVPFLLLAAFFFARSSDRLHNWLLTHPRFGPAILDWQDHGAIRRPMKWAATVSILAAFSISLALGLKPWLLAVQAATLIAVSIFIWSRPEV